MKNFNDFLKIYEFNYISSIDKIIDDLGYDTYNYLGSGFYGIAFLVSKGKDLKVLKITNDKDEAIIANKLSKRNLTKHLINYYDVREIKGLTKFDMNYVGSNPKKDDQTYTIVMDYVEPVDGSNKFTESQMDIIMEFLLYLRNLKSDNNIEKLYDKYKNDKKFIDFCKKQFDDTKKEMIKNKIYPDNLDLHIGNLGFDKDGNFVIFDLSTIVMKYKKPYKTGLKDVVV